MATVVRFPPSPTGKMHVGNARTALFNWMYARHTGGSFMFRIEDTDLERSTPENIAYIYEGLNWLGLTYDNTPFLQTSRVEEHKSAAKKLVDEGKAYIDVEGVTRFKVVKPGRTEWTDAVQGHITINHDEIEDFALLRSDGSPTYHLGVVCDDAFQGVSHVIRGDDHLSNTPKHILLFNALGYALPTFAHLPLILGADGAKLSKRHGAASIQDLRDAGYVPQAVFNYLIRLGWGHGDQEVFSRDEAITAFDIANISAGPARFDEAKLKWLNQHYLATLPMVEVWPQFEKVCGPFTAEHKSRLEKMWPELTKRAQTLPEVKAAGLPLLAENIGEIWQADAALTEIMLTSHMPLHWHYDALSAVTEWSTEVLEAVVKNVVAQHGNDFKAVGRPLRIALTASLGGPSLGHVMAALGQKETLERLKTALHHGHHHGAAH
jgi:glutamyl-tRNA synthetase